MQDPYQTYLDNLAAANSLIKPRFAPGLTEAAIIDAIRENAERLFRLHRENDAILQEILFSKTAQTLTASEADALRALAGALFNYNRSADVGIAYRIHQLLYEYARLHGDTDLIVRELYYQGITLFYLNVRDSGTGVNLFHEQIGAYFRAGAEYLSQYETLESVETRGYILRSLGNIKHSLRLEQFAKGLSVSEKLWADYLAVFTRAMEIFTSPRYREMNPELPWESFCYAMHYDRTQFLGTLRTRPDPEISAAVLESAGYVYRHQEQIAAAGERTVGSRTQYVYAAARYHAGQSELSELLDTLFSILDAAGAQDHSGDGIWTNLTVPEYLHYYAALLPEEAQRALRPRLDRAMENRIQYLYRLPVNEYAGQVSNLLLSTLGHSSKADDRFSNHVLEYILACHPPTFVHSEVLGMLTRWFCAHIADVAPAMLDGLLGIPHPAESPETLAAFLEQAYHVGLYHDVGKCMLLSYVGQYSRRLLDEEFACIKLHPVFGCSLLENLGLSDYACAAQYHHRAFDASGGYPAVFAECPQRTRLLVDIVTVADALDAGTDNVGRSYAAAKTFDQLVDELRAGRGRRYSPAVVDLLDDAAFYKRTKAFLEESRRHAYMHAYCGRGQA
ncbi:MAG: HD domain-containing protein [Subdoligranulum sp.]|nr:HD domain-containing protein [Subdoligranulum sp.]